MFRKPQHELLKLEDIIDNLIAEMAGHEANTKEYEACVKQLGALYRIRAENQPDRVSRDTIATVGANLLGIALILHYETVHVVTSKALSFIMKAR
jgi:predicted component of type VI protein secretion system